MAKKPLPDSKKIARLCKEAAENMKADNINILEIKEISTIADYFVICGGNSAPQLRAIWDETVKIVREELSRKPIAVSGEAESGWIVLDYGSVIMHIFSKPVREKYNLEQLWNDAPKLTETRRKKKK